MSAKAGKAVSRGGARARVYFEQSGNKISPRGLPRQNRNARRVDVGGKK